MSPDHPYFQAIEFLTSEGIVQGYENRSFQPERNINRAEFTKILMKVLYPDEYIGLCLDAMMNAREKDRAEELDENELQVIPYMQFPDVSYEAWYASYICAAWNNAIVSGFPDGKFRPEEGVKFVEAAKMLALGFGLTGLELPNFGASNVLWYQPYVEFLAAQNAIPYSIEKLDQPLNRGEMAEMIYRLKDFPLIPEAVPAKSKTADDVIYPVTFEEYENKPYTFTFAYPNIWPAPHVLTRGRYDGRSPHIPSEWTVYFGPKGTECIGANECVQRSMWIDGYDLEDASLIVDAIERDTFFIELEREDIINRLPTLIVREEVGKCVDMRAFFFGKRWVYTMNIECGAQDDNLINIFNQMIETFEEIQKKPPEHDAVNKKF